MVPAARSRRELKSRLLRGSELTAWLESSSPPVAAGALRAATVSSPRAERVRSAGRAATVSSMGWAKSKAFPADWTVRRY